MTPAQLIRAAILDDASYVFSEANVDELFREAAANGEIEDLISDFREGQVTTDIPAPWSRHYEARSVAAKIGDQWVGWTYWYGGGKHGCPDEIPWMEDAYFPTMEQLFMLGIVLKRVSFPLPRDTWHVLPGGVPYVTIHDVAMLP